MAAISRTYTFTDGTTAYGSQVESEISNITTTWNNHNSGTSKWGVVSALNASSTPLIADNSTGTNTIFEAKDNSSTVFTIADGGTVTIAPGGTTKVVANSSGLTLSNSATIAMGSAKITGLASGTTSGDAVEYSQLKVVTVKAVTIATTAFTTTSSSFQTTNLTSSITPSSASNRVLIIATGSIQINNGTASCFATLSRGGTNILGSSGGLEYTYTGTGTSRVPACLAYIDSPASTSALTYAVQIRNGDGTTTVGFGDTSLQQVIILAEIV